MEPIGIEPITNRLQSVLATLEHVTPDETVTIRSLLQSCYRRLPTVRHTSHRFSSPYIRQEIRARDFSEQELHFVVKAD